MLVQEAAGWLQSIVTPTRGGLTSLIAGAQATSVRSSLNLWRWAIPAAAASITSRLSNDLTVTLAMPLTVICPSPRSFFTRLFTRSMAVRSLYSRPNFLLSLGTGGCLLGSVSMGSLST